MERKHQDRLIPGNTEYLQKFIRQQNAPESEQGPPSMEEIVERAQSALSERSAEIVTRALLGQQALIIASDMKLGVERVQKTLVEAPRIIMHPSHYRAPKLMSAYAIAKETGRPKRWTLEQLRKSGKPAIEEGQVRKIELYREDEALDLINNKINRRPELAGDWLTVAQMAAILKKSYDWVEARVKAHFSELGEPRKNEQQRTDIYYPPEVLEALKEEVEELSKYPVVNSRDMAISELSAILERDEKWIYNRLEPLGIQSRRKINPVNNVVGNYFTKLDLSLLSKMNNTERALPVAGPNDGTINVLSGLLKHEKKWIIARLPYISQEAVTKINPNSVTGLTGKFYPIAETCAELRALPDNILKTKGSA
jgi:hypothetical protein